MTAAGTDTSVRFADGKDAGALRTIGEVASALGLKQHVLRYWEAQFPSLRPVTRAGGRRYYRPADIALLIEIDRLLHRDGYTIRGARAWLNTAGPGRAAELAATGQDDNPESATAIVDALTQLRFHLEGIRARLHDALT